MRSDAELLFVFCQLTEKMEEERKQREDMEQVREELCLEEQEETMRQKEIVSITTLQPTL